MSGGILRTQPSTLRTVACALPTWLFVFVRAFFNSQKCTVCQPVHLQQEQTSSRSFAVWRPADCLVHGQSRCHSTRSCQTIIFNQALSQICCFFRCLKKQRKSFPPANEANARKKAVPVTDQIPLIREKQIKARKRLMSREKNRSSSKSFFIIFARYNQRVVSVVKGHFITNILFQTVLPECLHNLYPIWQISAKFYFQHNRVLFRERAEFVPVNKRNF